MDYAVDTHALVWYFLDDDRLSSDARAALEETVDSGEVIVPAVVLAELMYIAEKGRVALSFGETLEEMERCQNFVLLPLDLDVLRATEQVRADLEMHDRIIVATARMMGAPLITRDQEIMDSGVVETMW